MWENKTGIRKKRLKESGGRYQVGTDGNIYSDGLPLKAIGGTWVSIGGERRSVAYLVARAFVPNAEGRPWVVHKNGDAKDNRAENLEWSEVREKGRKRGPKARVLRFGQFSQEGDLVKVWFDVNAAAESVGKSAACIRAALGRKGWSGGWRWMYF